MGVEPTHGPARCQYYVPICSGTGSVTPAFLCCQKIHIQFSTAEPCSSVYLPRGASRNCAAARPGGRALQRGSKASGAAGASPRPTENYPSKSGRPHGAAPTGLICLVLLGTFQRKGLRAAKGRPLQRRKNSLGRAGEDTRPYPDAGTVPFSSQGPVPDRPAGAHCAPLQRKTAPGRWVRQTQAQKWDCNRCNFPSA